MSGSTIHVVPEPAFGELYRGLSRRLEQIVRADVGAPEAVVEDACQFAWGRLLAQATRIRAEVALSWLSTTAVREARRLMHARERDVPLEAGEPGAAEPPGARMSVPAPRAQTDSLVEDRERLRLMRLLPERQQRMLWLHALGLSYEEIAAYTGDSLRTVERQLLRGRRRIRQLAI
jgi:RNA polymerase sigma factor (sigma-70 family)